MTEWLLTEKEWDDACHEMPDGTTCGDCRKTLARAQVQKMVSMLQQLGNWDSDVAICLNYKAWQSLLKEAGLEKE